MIFRRLADALVESLDKLIEGYFFIWPGRITYTNAVVVATAWLGVLGLRALRLLTRFRYYPRIRWLSGISVIPEILLRWGEQTDYSCASDRMRDYVTCMPSRAEQR